MNNLTEDQVAFISQIINESEIELAEMREDLIDHFCCAIEEEMNKGKSFQKSYDKAYQNICPNGFDEIQRETVYLFTLKKIKAMKKLMYLSGYLILIGLTTSMFLIISKTSFSGITVLLTAAILIFLFLPSLFLYLYNRGLISSISEKLKYTFGFIGTELLMVSALFRINHWPWSTTIFLAAILIINFAFFPFLFLKMYRKSSE
ncbi:MAG: hypothetical protein H7X84_12955 [Verrucomicrobia bacterium]|nr:hypothetical protein [Prolixibacteraceae bacterium]